MSRQYEPLWCTHIESVLYR